MKLPRGVRRWLHVSEGTADVGQRIDEELEFHIESRTESLMREGLARGVARARAHEEFGDMKQAHEELATIDAVHVTRARRAERWSGLVQDFRFAWRGVRRQPGFALVVALTLGLGLGVNVTAFELVDRLLFRPPELVAAPERVNRIYFQETFDRPGIVGGTGLVAQPSSQYVDYAAMRSGSRTMDVAAYMGTESTLGRGADARKLNQGVATASFFQVLGVRPHLGRFYTGAEDSPPHGEKLVVLDYGFWQRQFGGSSDVLGKPLLIGNLTYTIVGVTPRGFHGVELKGMDVWVPASVIAEEWSGADWWTNRSMTWLRVVGRRREGVSDERAASELTALYRASAQALAERDPTAAIVLGPIQNARGPYQSDEQRSGIVARWLAGVSLLVLLVACANVANLLLTRAIRQRRETGVRLALGIGRARLLRQLVVESLVFTALGGIAAYAFAQWAGGLLRAVFFTKVTWSRTLADARLLAFIGIALAITTLAIVAVPAYQILREHIIPALKSGPREGQARSRLRTALLFVQATFSVVLLVGAGLFVKSFYNVSTMDLGFDAKHVIIADIDVGQIGYTREQKTAFYLQARERIARLAGVSSAAIGTSVPFWSAMSNDVYAEGHDSLRIAGVGGPFNVSVTPEYFDAMGTRIVQGRGFTAADRKGAPDVAIVNETMAKLLWPGENVLGKCIYYGQRKQKPPCSQIVGVAQDTRKMSLDHNPVLNYYLSFDQHDRGLLALFVRTTGEPATVILAIQRELQTLAPNLPYADTRLLQDLIDPEMRSWKLGATLFGVFGVLALLLSGIGLYSALSHSVASRTTEVGVRMAFGARAIDVIRMIVKDGMSVTGAGILTGLVVAFLGAGRVAPMLFDVAPHDPLSYVLAGGVLVLVAFVAVLVPARRATSVDPIVALRAD